jgi:zinc and cadmium transporter
MTFLYIVIATLAGGLLSVLIAASLTVRVLGRVVHHLVSLSAGVLLSTALLNVLPEAFESKTASPQALFATLLGGLMFFFLLEKAELYRHGHHHDVDLRRADL